MDLLKRNHAPITPEAWEQIDGEAKRVLQLNLAGRKLVDFDGPHGVAVRRGQHGPPDHPDRRRPRRAVGCARGRAPRSRSACRSSCR